MKARPPKAISPARDDHGRFAHSGTGQVARAIVTATTIAGALGGAKLGGKAAAAIARNITHEKLRKGVSATGEIAGGNLGEETGAALGALIAAAALTPGKARRKQLIVKHQRRLVRAISAAAKRGLATAVDAVKTTS